MLAPLLLLGLVWVRANLEGWVRTALEQGAASRVDVQVAALETLDVDGVAGVMFPAMR